MDAAIATNLALSVLMPFACGVGGDLFAVVWDGERATGYDGAGRSPGAATLEAVRGRLEQPVMPHRHALTVTVPGAVEAWFELVARFGSRSFGELVAPAVDLAEAGFALNTLGRSSLGAAEGLLGGNPSWAAVYAGAAEAAYLRQPDLAATLRALADEGPDFYYRGRIARAIADEVQQAGGLLEVDDLAAHAGEWVSPLTGPYRDVVVIELPPPTQGVTALEAFGVLDGLGPLPRDGPDRVHLLIEVFKAVLADRRDHVGDPSVTTEDAARLLSDAWITDRVGRVDQSTASHPPPVRPVAGGTVYLCAADSDGMIVSLSQSNFMGFGSGLTVPGWGINLHNRGAYFRLDGVGADTIGPRQKPLHTLIPALALRAGRPWLAFGTMGGDDQVGIQMQLLTAIVDDGAPAQEALDRPRWSLSPTEWTVGVENATPADVVAGLEDRGHHVQPLGGRTVGWAQAIEYVHGFPVTATDTRTDPRD